MKKGDIMHAVFFYEKALTMDSTRKETLDLVDKALQIDPVYEDALRYKAAILCDSKKYAECIEVCDLILYKVDPYCEEPNVYGMKAEALSSLSKHREAVKWISESLKYANKNTSYQQLKVKYEERARSSLFGI
jgi:tetratricopeptide (TPR) repeat protein